MALPVMSIDGNVVEAHSYWVEDGSRIVTEATIATPDGNVVVSQLGGSVDGVGMIQMPGPELLTPGMQVAIAAHSDVDLAQQEHLVVDGVKIYAYPPEFVRTGPTKAGHYLFWESGCIFVTVDSAGTSEVPFATVSQVVDASIATWNDSTASCSYMKVKRNPDKAMEVGKDYVNVIKFRDTSWCRPAVGNDPMRCYASSAAGITTAVFVDDPSSDRDGAIVDADIEINGKDFAISVDGQTTGKQPCHSELQNTLTHELGHLHGLEHPCLAAGDPPRVDDQGHAVPQCSQTTDPKITEATMYNFQDCGETKKETLSPDDTSAICTIYPIDQDPKSCEAVHASTGCCSASDRPDGVLLLAGATALIIGRRRKNSQAA